jgi:hypothetical protein
MSRLRRFATSLRVVVVVVVVVSSSVLPLFAPFVAIYNLNGRDVSFFLIIVLSISYSEKTVVQWTSRTSCGALGFRSEISQDRPVSYDKCIATLRTRAEYAWRHIIPPRCRVIQSIKERERFLPYPSYILWNFPYFRLIALLEWALISCNWPLDVKIISNQISFEWVFLT